jgi:hypothetical protein
VGAKVRPAGCGRRRASNFGASIFGRPCWRGMRGVVRVTPWAWVCSWMPRADGRCGWVRRRHSTCAGGLAAALGDAGFGTSARRGSLPSPALGVMLPAGAGASLNWGMVAFQAREIGRLTRLPGGGPERPLAVLGQMGRARLRADASGCACGTGAELERGQGAVREDKEPRLLASGA